MKRLTFCVLATVLLVSLGSGSVLALTSGQGQLESPLTKLALQPFELPEGSRKVVDGLLTPDDVTHPLNKSNRIIDSEQLEETLYSYIEGYTVSSVVWDGKHSAYAGNYLYRYSDTAQAEVIAQALFKSIQNRPGSLVYDQAKTEGGNVHGQAAMFVGAEGGAIYWFVGAKDDVLILLMVNGMPGTSTQTTFETLMNHMLKR